MNAWALIGKLVINTETFAATVILSPNPAAYSPILSLVSQIDSPKILLEFERVEFFHYVCVCAKRVATARPSNHCT